MTHFKLKLLNIKLFKKNKFHSVFLEIIKTFYQNVSFSYLSKKFLKLRQNSYLDLP